MNWHIITSSKGGVGKTLISMLVTKSLIEKHKNSDKKILLLDLNAMNPDSKNLLVTRKELREAEIIRIPLSISYSESGDNKIYINVIRLLKYPNIFIGWLNQTYFSFSPDSFFILLEELYSFVTVDNRLFKVDEIIIDTNYHIANIFSRNPDLYNKNEVILKLFKEERFFIWFIWVYRQILNFKNSYLDNPEIVKANLEFLDVVAQIEDNLKSEENHEPLVHVFTPVVFSKTEKFSEIIKAVKDDTVDSKVKVNGQKVLKFLSHFFEENGALMDIDIREDKTKNKEVVKESEIKDHNKFIEIPCLKEIAKLPIVNESICFADIEDSLKENVSISEKKQKNKKINQNEAFEVFLENLAESLKIDYNGRPKNIIPISTYEYALIGHTDKSKFNFNDYNTYVTYKLFNSFFTDLLID